MKAYTLQEAIDLGIGVTEDEAQYIDYYGPDMEVAYIQAEVAYQYSSVYVANTFNWSLYVVFGAVLFLGAVRRFVLPQLESRLSSRLQRFQQLLRAHLILAGTADKHISEPIGWSIFKMQIPSRWHSFMVFAYVATNLVIIFTPYWIVQPNVFWQDLGWPFTQYLRYFSDRTGILAFGSTPLVVLLAARNSPITWLTGASFSTLQIYHRWIARVTFLNALLHTIGYTVATVMTGSETFYSYFADPYWRAGWAAFSGGCALVLLSFRPIRERFYELFLIVHIVGILLWVVGCFYHVYFLGPDNIMQWLKYIYIAIAFWAFDRALRPLRILWLNTPRRAGGKKRLLDAEGHVSKCGSYVRVVVRPPGSFPAWSAMPGAYIFAAHPSWFLGSHPFTISWPMHLPTNDGEVASDSFEFLIRKQGGYTKSLFRRSSLPWDVEELAPHSVVPIRMYIEGPYGSGHSLIGYDSVCLIAGGSGISAAVCAHLADIAKHACLGNLQLQKVQVIWAIRDLQTAEVLSIYLHRFQELVGEKATSELLEVFVYHTAGHDHLLASTVEGPTHHIDTFGDDKEKGAPDLAQSSPETAAIEHGIHDLLVESTRPAWRVQIHHGRPVLAEHIGLLDDSQKTAVLVCGPLSMVDDARLCVRQKLARGLQGGGDLHFMDEAFQW